MSYPLDEIDLFFSNLETILTLIKNKTGFLFAPVVLQRCLMNPMTDFMVVLRRVGQESDIKLKDIYQYRQSVR